MPGDEARQLPLPVPLHLHREANVGAVEAEHELLHGSAEQLVGNVVPRHLVGGCRQRDRRDPGEELPEPAQVGVFRPERRAPLRDAMGLVDGEQRQRKPRERRQHPVGHQPFRGHVEEPRLPFRGALPGGDVLRPAVAGVDAVRCNTGEPQRRHLVLHQRDQRRHHDRQTVHDQRGDLEAERLARARRHHGERVPARQERLDHSFLARPEPLETEHHAQHPGRGRRIFPGGIARPAPRRYRQPIQ